MAECCTLQSYSNKQSGKEAEKSIKDLKRQFKGAPV